MLIRRPDRITRSERGHQPTVAKLGPEPVDTEQYQRFLDKARELGLDPSAETDLAHLRDVTRRLAKLPTRRAEPMKGKRRGAPKHRPTAE
jgi:hypothetical protein